MSEKQSSIGKIKNEIQFIKNYPFTDIGIHIDLPKGDNIFEWKGYLIGPDDTPYKGGIFNFKIIFPYNFPEKSPEIIFLNPIYHLNVNPKYLQLPGAENLGHVSISFLNWWNGKQKIREILIQLYTMFYLNNPEGPYGLDRAQEFMNNRYLFDKKVKYFTGKYANPISAFQIYSNSWDFSYNINDDTDNIIIIFEMNGISRINFQANKKEIAKNVILRYSKMVGIEHINKLFFYHNSKRMNLSKTIEENDIENNSLIVVINAENILLG